MADRPDTLAQTIRDAFEFCDEDHVAAAGVCLDELLRQRDGYRIEADCGMRDYDALELEQGLLQERVRELEAALRQIAHMPYSVVGGGEVELRRAKDIASDALREGDRA